jgi:low temperature requirement protein LtrA
MATPYGRPWRATAPQSVTFVELFFDLVFVFAITQITAYAAHHLTLDGVLVVVLLFWLIWWAWTQFTWTLNPADTTHRGVRLVTLIATAAAFVMATAVPGAFEDDGLWFALPYIVVRVLGLGLQVRVDMEVAGSDHSGLRRWVALSSVGLVLVLVGAVADPGLRPIIWGLAIAADVVAATLAGSRESWDLSPAHLSERHGLIVIIALGESIIVAGAGVVGEARTPDLVAAVGIALIVTCLLWWTYFGWLKDALEHACAAVDRRYIGPIARDAYSLAHFPLIGGIIGFAAAVEEIVLHPDEAAPVEVVIALAAGIVLFVGSSALAYWRLRRRVLTVRLGLMAVLVIALAGTAAMSLAPAWSLAVVAVVLAVLVVIEERWPPEPAGTGPGGHEEAHVTG